VRLTLDDVKNALGGTPSSPDAFTGVSTDTRTIQPGDLFVALVSPNADGHTFVPQALAAGAAGLVVSRPVDAPSEIPVFLVPDTQIAYGQIARAWRDKFDIPVIGVTGSVGKTTVKEMLAAALTPLGPVLKTAASQNNETGVPKALLQLNEDHKAAVIEMGMRGAGQIAYLCGIARPTIGVITLIGENHVELLGSQDAIADAKGELLAALPETGTAVLNADDPYFERLRTKTSARVVTFGGGLLPALYATLPAAQRVGASAVSKASGDVLACPPVSATAFAAGERGPLRSKEVGSWRFTLRGVPVEIRSPSRHDITNAVASLTIAEILGVPLETAAAALLKYEAPPMRMEAIPAPWGGTILNDAYNAAPASVRSALETLTAQSTGRKIAFLGDMKELGDLSETAHKELGSTIAALGGLDALYAVGGLAALIPGATATFPDSAAAADFAGNAIDVRPGDTILVKGSRAMAMERIAHALQTRHDH
jgi:UDP-N-acetylmuramoyl-tripeptide--D-alanyl-D-alanine ligase